MATIIIHSMTLHYRLVKQGEEVDDELRESSTYSSCLSDITIQLVDKIWDLWIILHLP